MHPFEYADSQRWEEWQKEYHFGAFYIFPPDSVIQPIEALRRRYDPKSASICQAHLSLSEPLTNPLTETQLRELQDKLASIQPFEIRYGPLRSFPPYPGVTYAIQPEDVFMALRSAIHSTSLFEQSTLGHAHIPPHMTIAEFITLHRTDELLHELSGHVPEGTFPCTAIEYAVPNRDFTFERVLSVPLAVPAEG